MATRVDSILPGTYYLLDMGRTKYGECIVCVFGNIRILIDGGHRGDFAGQQGFRSIPEQLEKLFGGKNFHFDLLVVTHCHDDHIGCLPELVSGGIVTAEWALVTDERWGYGREGAQDGADDFGLDDADPEVRGLVAALCEEDHSDLPPDQLQMFIDASATVESRYIAMLKRLAKDGTKVIRHARDTVPPAFKTKFAATGLSVLGPTRKQLELCNAALRSYVSDATAAVRRRRAQDAGLSAPALYRDLIDLQSSGDAADMAATAGPPRNNQSIMLAFGGASDRALLGGDMQLAKSEVKGMDAEMNKLRTAVRAAGPYAFVKTLHHTSYNGQNDDILAEWGPPKLLAHSGGRQDPGHPDKGTLQMLKEHRADLDFARTDRNGVVVVKPGQGFKLEQGKLDDFSANRAQDEEPGIAAAPGGIAAAVMRAAPGGARDVQIIVARMPYAPARITIGGTEIELQPLGGTAGIAAGGPGDADPARRTAPATLPAASGALKLAAGRTTLPPLLFVTDPARLARNIGRSEADQALAMIEGGAQKQKVLRLRGTGDPFAEVRSALAADDRLKGVVLVGGYDVVPSQRLDVLTPQIRAALGGDTNNDADNFIVWSDDAYGDSDASGFPDVPVSRIPDGRDAELLLGALGAEPGNGAGRFGIRNVNRPFADKIWGLVPGKEKLNTSEPFVPAKVRAPDLDRRHLYFMLHGSSGDGRVFYGEMEGDASAADAASAADTATVPAIRADQMPHGLKGVALAGCCWGALTVDELAAESAGRTPTPRVPGASIALTLLKSGVLGFVGCTGSHYSPNRSGDYFGGPMQNHFWTNHCSAGMAPAPALFEAKRAFLKDMPHSRTDTFERAIERKILHQFTCLGLGW